MTNLSSQVYDVIVIGGGVVGCAILRELSKYELKVLLLERASDVCEGTSKANSAIIHTGFDAKPGTLEAKLVAESSRIFPRLAEELKIPFAPVGAVLVARSDEEAAKLPALKAQGEQNGVDDLVILTRDEVLAREPNVDPSVKAGLLVPRESIACGFTTVVAYAENALANGASILLDAPVTAIRLEKSGAGGETGDTGGAGRGGGGSGGRPPLKRVVTPRGEFAARFVVNAAGLWSDEVHGLLRPSPFRIRPRKGEFLILDRSARSVVNGIILPMPTPKTKGILVAPTIYGNVLMGPTAVDVERKDDLGVTEEGLKQVESGALGLVPRLGREPVIATYAGLRAASDASDYIVSFLGDLGWVDVAGIRSTGLSSSPALAAYVVEGLRDIGLVVREKEAFEPSRPPEAMPGWSGPRPFADPGRIRRSPAYGRIVCYCESVSEQEIVDAVRAPLPASTLDAVKRRTRAMTGRCQGFNCMARVAGVMARELGVPAAAVTKCGPGSEIAVGNARRAAGGAVDARVRHHPPRDIPAEVDVAVVGGGPAGLGAAARLKELGAHRVLVLEREPRPGGIPAWYTHMRSFGLLHFKRLLTGAEYARRLVERAERCGVDLRTSVQVLAVRPVGGEAGGGVTLEAVSPEHGVFTVRARAVVLATGCREQPRSALKVPGSRPAGVLNTATALHLIDEMGHLPGREAVVFGSEFVGFSAAAMLHGAGAQVRCVVDDAPQRQGDLAGVAYFLWPRRVPLKAGYRIAEIAGEKRLEAVRLEPVAGPAAGSAGRSAVTVRCDTLVVAGRFTPNSELCAPAGIEVDAATRGPAIDNFYRTNVPGIFACGNVLRGAESADTALSEGLRAAEAVKRYLDGTLPAGPALVVERSDDLAYVLPQRFVPGERPAGARLSVRLKEFRLFPRVQAHTGGRRVGSAFKPKATPVKTIVVKLDAGRLPEHAQSILVRLAD